MTTSTVKRIYQLGFTFIEAILYVSVFSIMLTTLIPFVWNIISIKAKSSVQLEVSSNARFISERIKYEIRNSTGVNSISTNSISLVKSTGSLNPTIITWSNPNITIKQGSSSTTNLNSADVKISNFSFSNNSSADNKTKNIGVLFTIEQANVGSRADFSASMTYQSAFELRGI